MMRIAGASSLRARLVVVAMVGMAVTACEAILGADFDAYQVGGEGANGTAAGGSGTGAGTTAGAGGGQGGSGAGMPSCPPTVLDTSSSANGWQRARGAAFNPSTGDTIVGGSFSLDMSGFGPELTRGNASGEGFVALYGANGRQQWITRLNTTLGYRVSDVAVAPSGEVYIAGSYAGESPNIQPDTGTTLGGVVTRLSSTGGATWHTTFTGPPEPAHIFDIAVSPSGETIAIVGVAFAAIDVDNCALVADTADGNLFLAGLDPSGTCEWMTLLGKATGNEPQYLFPSSPEPTVANYLRRAEYPVDVAFRAEDEIVVTGLVSDAYLPIPAFPIQRGGFVGRFDANGVHQDSLLFGQTTAGDEAPTALAIAPDGAAWITGSFEEDIVNAGLSLINVGLQDIFILRWDPTRNQFTHAQAWGGEATDAALGIAVTPDDNVVIAGISNGDFSFDPIPVSHVGPGFDVFVLEADANLDAVGAATFPGASSQGVALEGFVPCRPTLVGNFAGPLETTWARTILDGGPEERAFVVLGVPALAP